jgi:hypothetical protein
VSYLHPERINLFDIAFGILYIWGAYGLRFSILKTKMDRVLAVLFFTFLMFLGGGMIVSGVAPVLE